MKLEYLHLVKFTVRTWGNPVDSYRYSIQERGFTLVTAGSYPTEAEAEDAARKEFYRILEQIDHE